VSVISSENAAGWQKLADSVESKRPIVGRRVRVTVGRKWIGTEGTVTVHWRDHGAAAWRYGSDANFHLRDMQGTYGFRVKVRKDDGAEFWCDADKVEVIPS
jgi:hypothetical protein